MYAILRISNKKIKNFADLKGFENHAERKKETPNANPKLQDYNTTFVGTDNIVSDMQEYLEDVKLRKNSILATELLLTASPEFFKNLNPDQFEEWVKVNVQWLKSCFGEHLRYCKLHVDETSPHFTVLVSAKFWDEKKQVYKLAASRYFDGPQKLIEWQNAYAENLEQFGLSRGIKGSKAKHQDIKTFYKLLNKEPELKDIKSVQAYSLQSNIVKERLRTLETTCLKLQNEKVLILERNQTLGQKLQELDKDQALHKQIFKELNKAFKITKKEFNECLELAQQNLSKTHQNEL
jgi:hypothetical protein